ncbi:unnamed protein product [Allacma fusca]|uniref:DH domain-containing protein n=1 Tax=Allacma fusca TaxID=39272 RepID=A0A8J2JXS3_9HEXA|nr:unnamed protein product [Allacma fusca]
MDGTGSLVTVSVEEDNGANNVSMRPSFDLGMTLAEIGMGVSIEMDEPEGVEGEVCPRNPEADDEESLLDIPELSRSSCGLPPRTIPFRSASFSQVDITSEGKYVRNPRSPITLKPTAFCFLNTSGQKGSSPCTYGYSASTLPRHGEKSSAYPKTASDSQTVFTNSKLNLLPLPPLASTTNNKKRVSRTEGKNNRLVSSESDFSTIENKDYGTPILEINVSTNNGTNAEELNNIQQLNNNGNAEDYKNFLNSIPQQIEEKSLDPDKTASMDSEPVHFYLDPEDTSTEVTQEFKLAESVKQPCDFNPDSQAENPPTNECEPPQIPNASQGEEFLSPDPTMGAININASTSGVSNDEQNEAAVSSVESMPEVTSVAESENKMFLGVKVDQEKFSGPEVNTSVEENERNQLLRQSSGQSDGSDEIPQLGVLSASHSSNIDLTCSSPPLEKEMTRHNFPGDHRTHLGSPPIGSSVPSLAMRACNYESAKKEISRANSVSCTSGPEANSRPLPPRRYNKRPLRGPYGEMLEAEMNKLIPGRSLRDYDNSDFCRESKSSSPNRSLLSSLSQIDPDPRAPQLASANPLLMASMDDLHFSTSQSKALNPRCRKISSQLPAQASHFPGENAPPLAFHQRTASSPSQLLYTTSVDREGSQARPEMRKTVLDGSPRGHVLAEVVETEKSYVDSLRILVKKYMEPLKSLDFIDAGLVDEIFFQIPKILWHHESLLDAFQKRVTDDMQCVGDVLLETFRQNSLLECYSLFVNNWKNAKGSLKMAVASKPPLARFLEDNARQHKGKLTLDSLLIMPIQRIPRYELLVKELLKHTDPNHEDHSRLNIALENIKQFALHIDCASVDPNDNREIEIEGWGSGLGHLVRQDIVTLCTNSNGKKERALFLFADSLVIASIKRKSTMRKPSASTSHNPANSWDGCKFKLLMKVPLMDAHLLNEDHDVSSISGTVTTTNKSTSSSSFASKSGGGGSLNSHEETDDLKIIHKMMELATMLKCSHAGLDEILKDLASGLKHHYDNGDAVDFEIKTSDNSDSPEVLRILFGSAEKKSGWLESFQDTLSKFIRYGFGKTPQVQFMQALPIRKTRAGLQLSCAAPVSLHNKVSKTLEMSDVWVANSDGYVGQICILTLHPEPAITSCNGVCNSRITCIVSVPPPVPPQAQPLHPALAAHHHHEEYQQHPHVHSLGYESEDDSHRNRQGHKATEHWSVWLGTEDGGLHVYDCSDSVRVKKNRHKIQHNAPLHCIVYFDSRVFVSLGNGDVAVYSRNTSGKGWSISDPSWVTIGSALNPVTKMICVRSQIWCGCGSQIKVYGENGGMLELLQSIQVTVEGSHVTRGISCIVVSDEHVWVSVQGTSILKCYNIVTFECLFETNVSADVAKILAGCDDIIRQHKSACLRITALLLAPDKTLWVGTSAGVILTVNYVNQTCKTTPLCYGHTGQVRFMTCCTTRDSCTVISGGDGYEEFRPLPAMFHVSNNNTSSFGSMMSSLMGESSVDISGREDSTNHLLIWKIPKPS